MKNLSFWAQSLDNQSPDVLFKDGKELSDDELRQQLVLEIYEIPRNRMKILSVDSAVTIRYSDPIFLIEAIPIEKDRINRLAPVVIYGVFPNDLSETWVKNVCKEIENFVSNRLKRTLDNSALVAIQDWLSNDIYMKSLIDQRKGRNPIKSRELTLNLSEESMKNFKAITDIKVPIYGNLQAQLDRVKKEVYEFTLTVKVEF